MRIVRISHKNNGQFSCPSNEKKLPSKAEVRELFNKIASERNENNKLPEVWVVTGDGRDKLDGLIYDTLARLLTHSYENSVETYEISEAASLFPNSKDIRIGTYALHPYDDKTLVPIESYHNMLAIEKDHELLLILCRLGAKKVFIEENVYDMSEASAEVDVNVKLSSISIEGSGKKVTEKGQMLIVEFEALSQELDFPSDILEKSRWFKKDSILISLVEGRLFPHNRIRKMTIRNTYSESFDFDFEAAASYIISKVDLKSKFAKLSKKTRLFHVEF